MEEGSEEEEERSFEEEFASVVAPGEGLEEVLKSLDEELQEGNWTARKAPWRQPQKSAHFGLS